MKSMEKLASDFDKYFGQITVNKGTVSKSDLQEFAKIASEDFLTRKIPLNTSISTIYKENTQLNPNHVKRISEMANNEVHERLFRTSEDKNIQFELADSDKILNTEPQKIIDTTKTAAYLRSPKQIELEKTASEQVEEYKEILPFNANPKKTMLKIGEKLLATKEELESIKIAEALKLNHEYGVLLGLVKEALETESFAKIASALFEVSNDKSIFTTLTSDLVRAGFDYNTLTSGSIKMAGMSVNHDHPLINQYTKVIKIANNLYTNIKATELIDADIKKVNDVLRG